MKKGLSLLDFVYLNQKTDYSSTELKSLIKAHGSLEYNIAKHIRLMNKIPEFDRSSKDTKWLDSRPFHLLVKKIQEIELRIDKYILLMLDTEVDLPDTAINYVRLQDIVDHYKNETPGDQAEDPLNALGKEIKILNNERAVQNKIIKKLKRRTRYKLGDLEDAHIEIIVDKTRKKNGVINYTKAGKELGVSRETLKREIEKRNLTYLTNSPSD